MKVDDVQPLAAQAPERRLHAGRDAGTGPVGHAGNAAAHLGGEPEFLPPAGQVAAGAGLRKAIAPGRVDEVHAQVQHRVQQVLRFGFRDAAIVEVHGAQARGVTCMPVAPNSSMGCLALQFVEAPVGRLEALDLLCFVAGRLGDARQLDPAEGELHHADHSADALQFEGRPGPEEVLETLLVGRVQGGDVRDDIEARPRVRASARMAFMAALRSGSSR